MAVVVGVFLGLPHWLNAGYSLKASAVLIFAMIAISIVVLTGWAGQVSSARWASRASARRGPVATKEWGLDLTLAIPLAGLAGAAVATVVGLPALRLRGLYLGVATLAFALATSSYFLNRQFFDWIPVRRIERPDLLGIIDLNSPTRIYYLALATLALALLAVRGSVAVAPAGSSWRSENEPAARRSASAPPERSSPRSAISGFLAAAAGAVFVHHQQSFSVNQYAVFESFSVFSMAVIGGLGSLSGALAEPSIYEAPSGSSPHAGSCWRPRRVARRADDRARRPRGRSPTASGTRCCAGRRPARDRGPQPVADVRVEDPDLLQTHPDDEPAMGDPDRSPAHAARS